MNPRATFMILLGWCPGSQAAAKFIPDRDVSNRRIALSLTLVFVAAVSSYMISNAVLVWADIPSTNLKKSFNHPVLGVLDGRLYISVGQLTSSSASAFTGPGYLQLGIYFGELLDDGKLTNVKVIDRVKWGAGLSQSLLATNNGIWKLVYGTHVLTSISNEYDTSIRIVESADGVTWSNSVNIYDKPVNTIIGTLIEYENGLLLLFRSNGTWMYTTTNNDIWSKPSTTPFCSEKNLEGIFMYESAFIDKSGQLNVIWDEGSFEGNDLGLRYSTLKNGVWSDPRILTSNSVPLYGQRPRVLYSKIKDGYYLCVTSLRQEGSPEQRPVTQIFFSHDWVSWEQLCYFESWGHSIAEQVDGSLARVVIDRSGSILYYSESMDGRSWSPPVQVPWIVDDVEINSESNYQRSNWSYLISIIVSVATLIIFTKVSIV